MDRQLVFDIGLHNGDDAAYYLHLGHRVVGVEANPILAKQCEERFSLAVSEGRMVVVNAGILREPGVFTFYRNITDSGNSSFDPQRGKRGEWEEISIPCMTTMELISKHGLPFFMKVDIEGADLQTLHSLTPDSCPAYLSLELNPDDPIVERLIELGYDCFKFVDGETYRPTAPIFDHEPGWRFLRKAGRIAPIVRDAVRTLPEGMRARSEWNPEGKYNPDGYSFTKYNSGPFGEQAAGQWMPGPEALRWFRQLCENYAKQGWADRLWWDVHARHGSVKG